MWATVALMATLDLAPMPVNQLKLSNDRVTHGILGWERKDSKNPKLYPGDVFILVFDIEGLTTSDTGLVKYSMGMELRDKNNVVKFSKDPEDLEATAALGGQVLAASAQTSIGTDTELGRYTMKVTVVDRSIKKNNKVELTRSFEVVPAELGLTRLIVTYDTNAPAPPVAVPGQVYIVNFAPVGFTLDNKNQPSVSVRMRILDQQGKPVLEKPFVGGATMVEKEFRKIIPMQFILSLNRTGKFRIHLEVTDNLTKKSAEETLDFEVLGAK